MKKHLMLVAAILLIQSIRTSAQTNIFPTTGSAGIGTLSPNGSATLDMVSTTKGILVPRMTKTQRDAIVTPATGLLIFQTNSTPGFYFYTGTAWSAISTKGANLNLSNLSPAGTSINQNLTPATTGIYDLGSSLIKWDEIYANAFQFPSGSQTIPFIPESFTNDLIPADDVASNLGSDAKRWNGVYTESLHFADGTSMSTVPVGGGGAETDPQVGANTTGFIPKWDGSALSSGILQDNGSGIYMGASLYALGSKFAIENTSTTRNLYLINSLSGTGGQEGINNWLQSNSTGSKIAIKNTVWQSFSGTGNVYGVLQEIQKYGTSPGYGLYNNFDIIGSSTNHGVYTTMVGGTGTQYGTYTSLNSSGSQYGHYVTLGSSSGNHYGYMVTSTGTTGTHYGVFSQVSTANSLSYAAYLIGKVYASGNVGIATSSPATKLHVEGGTDAALASGGYITSGDISSINVVVDNNEIMARNNGAASTLYLNNDGGNISMCYTSGNVMIGSSVPATGYLLTVDGKIMCEELKVQMSESWPDYVFADNYKMPTLYELENSIKANKHLPGIPSAEEVENNGIAVGEMQTLMMEKIEELTLYIIDLQKQLDDIKEQK